MPSNETTPVPVRRTSAERIAQYASLLDKAMTDAENAPREAGPFTVSAGFWDGPGFQIHDANSKPILTDLIRDPDDAATLVRTLNALFERIPA